MYKVFDLRQSDGQPLFLFHGLHGARAVELDKWLTAERKKVRDGSGKTWYESGFHLFVDKEAILDWLKTVKNVANRAVVKVEYKGIRPKSHSRLNIVLASKMRLTRQVWDQREDLSIFEFRERWARGKKV